MTKNLVSIFQQEADLPADRIPDWMVSKEPSSIAGGLSGGARDRIGLKGNRFRLIQGGDEVAKKDEPFIDVVIVTASEHVSRIYYKDKWKPDTKVAPDCFSPDGIKPFDEVPNKQSEKCSECKQNVKGSAITDDHKKTRACSFAKRIVVWLYGDPDKTLYQMDLKSMSIFGDGLPNNGLYTLSGYAKLLQSKKIRAEAVVTRISFDDESSVPKLYFTPQQFLKKSEYDEVVKLANSPEAKELATVDITTLQPDNPDTVTEEKEKEVDPLDSALAEVEDAPVKTEPKKAEPKKAEPKKEAPKKEPASVEVASPSNEVLLSQLDELLPSK